MSTRYVESKYVQLNESADGHLAPISTKPFEQLKWSIKVVIFNYKSVTLSFLLLLFLICIKCTVNTIQNSAKAIRHCFIAVVCPLKAIID